MESLRHRTGIRAGKVHISLCVSNYRFPLPHREGKWLKQFDLVSALGEGRHSHRVRHHGRVEPGSGTRAVCRKRGGLRNERQAALEQARFTKGTFEGCDVQMENTISASVRDELTQRIRQPGVQLKSRAAVPLTCCGCFVRSVMSGKSIPLLTTTEELGR